ncbi:unnamed protein product, partial [Chrysoparadoxa australica]
RRLAATTATATATEESRQQEHSVASELPHRRQNRPASAEPRVEVVKRPVQPHVRVVQRRIKSATEREHAGGTVATSQHARHGKAFTDAASAAADERKARVERSAKRRARGSWDGLYSSSRARGAIPSGAQVPRFQHLVPRGDALKERSVAVAQEALPIPAVLHKPCWAAVKRGRAPLRMLTMPS